VIEWIGTIPTKYQPLWEDSDGKSPSFLQYLPQVCKVGLTIDRWIKMIDRKESLTCILV